VDTSILRHEQQVGFGVPPRMWTHVSYDTRSQFALEYVTNVDTSILRQEEPVGFVVP